MRTMIICLAAGLAGCVTGADMDARLTGLVGRPVQVAVDRLGPPTGQDGGAYFWRIDQDESLSTAEAPNRFGIGDPVAMSEGVTQTPTTTYHLQCWIRLEVGQDDKITAFQWSKSSHGCGRYAARLSF